MRRAKTEGGFALIAVIAVLIILAALVGAISLHGRLAVEAAINAKERLRTDSDLEGGFVYTLARILSPSERDLWLADGTAYKFAFDEKTLVATVRPEGERIDINASDPLVIATGLARMGLREEEAAQLAARIADWADTDDDLHLNGAERNQYRAAGRQAYLGNRPFGRVEELSNVLGFPRELMPCALELFTVNSFAATPMGPSERAEFAQQLASALRDGEAGQTVRIEVAAPLESGASDVLTVVLRLTGDSDVPYRILDWRTGVRPKLEEGAAASACPIPRR